VGIVGAGVVARRLAGHFATACISSSPSSWRTSFVGVCDVNREAAQALADRHSARQRHQVAVYPDYQALCASDDVDLIYVAVPPSFHAEVTLCALACGKHVLCEKPLALTDEETRRMVDAAEASGKVCAVNLPFRYAHTMRRFRELLDGGYVGRPSRVQLTFRFPQWPRHWQRSAWVGESKEGGPLREVGTHFFFALLELFPSDPPKRVQAHIKFPDDQGRCEESGWGLIQLESGLICVVDLLVGVASPEENSLTVLGNQGTLSLVDWSYLKGQTREQALSENKARMDVHATDEDVDCSHAVVLDLLGTVSGTLESTLVSFRTGQRANQILNALYASNGNWTTL